MQDFDSENSGGTRLKILVAEDDPTNRMFLVRLLQHIGYEALAAKNGYEVLAILERDTPAAILMDIQMPGMDGLEATRRIREGGGPWPASIPVVVTTAYILSEDDEQELAQFADEQVPKPVEPDVLRRVLAKVLQGGGKKGETFAHHTGGGGEVPAGGDDVLDRAKTLARLQNDEEFVAKIYQVFLSSLDDRTQRLTSACESGDLDTLCKEAHALKGAATTINAETLRRRALATELAARQRDQAACTRFLAELWPALSQVRERIEGILGTQAD